MRLNIEGLVNMLVLLVSLYESAEYVSIMICYGNGNRVNIDFNIMLSLVVTQNQILCTTT